MRLNCDGRGLYGKRSNFYSTVTENIQLDVQRARIIGPTTRTDCRVNDVTPDRYHPGRSHALPKFKLKAGPGRFASPRLSTDLLTPFLYSTTPHSCQVSICQFKILPSVSFDQRVRLDFTIPNLFNVKGKIGAYGNLVENRLAQKVNKMDSCSHWRWIRHWHNDCFCVCAEWRQGLYRVSQGGAAQGGRSRGTHARVWYYIFANLTERSTPNKGLRKAEQNRPWLL